MTWERVTVRSRISPLKPGAKIGITTGGEEDEEGGDDAQHHRHQQQQGRGEPERVLVVLLADQFGEDRDEGRLQGGVGEEGADQVRDLEGDREGRHRAADAVVAGGDDFAAEAGDPRGGGGDREEGGGAGDPARLAPRRGSAGEFLAGVEGLGLAQRRIGVDSRPLVVSGCVGCLGRLQAGFSVAIVGGRLGLAPRQPGHLTHGQHSLTEEADPTQRARALGEPAAHQHGQDPFPPARERRRGWRRHRDRHRGTRSRLEDRQGRAEGRHAQEHGGRKKSKAARIAAS